MSRDPRRIAFIKTLVAAAWADGSLNAGELRTLTEYLERFEITDDEFEQLRPLIDEPISAETAEQLLQQQLESLRTPEERSALLAAVGMPWNPATWAAARLFRPSVPEWHSVQMRPWWTLFPVRTLG